MASGIAVLRLSHSTPSSRLLGSRQRSGHLAGLSLSPEYFSLMAPALDSSASSPPTPSHLPLTSDPPAGLALTPPALSSPASLHPRSKSSLICSLRPSYALGLVYLGCVILLWVLSGALIQWIFEQQEDAQPFFLTYFCTSLFTLYMPTYFALQACRRMAVYQRIAPEGSGGDGGSQASPLLSMREHLHLAFLLSPIWFLMEYLYNASLALTTLSQNTILSTTSGVFVLALNCQHPKRTRTPLLLATCRTQCVPHMD